MRFAEILGGVMQRTPDEPPSSCVTVNLTFYTCKMGGECFHGPQSQGATEDQTPILVTPKTQLSHPMLRVLRLISRGEALNSYLSTGGDMVALVRGLTAA